MDYVIVDIICVNMPVLSSEDKALIKVLRVEKGWIVDRMMREFPARQWKRLNKAHTDCDKTQWHTSKLILLESVSTDIYKAPHFD